MWERRVNFFSDGIKLEGTVYTPEAQDPESKKTVLLVCSGFMGLKRIHPERFARALTRRGHICFGFDYRGFGKSGGERGRVLLQEQIRDIENAAIFLSRQKETQGKDIALVGWGMGAGLILEAANEVPRLCGLISINGFYNGKRFLRSGRTEKQWRDFLDWVAELRTEEVLKGEVKRVNPFKIYLLDKTTKQYVDDVLFKTEGFGGDVELNFAYSLMHYNPECHLDSIPEVPLLVVHGQNNNLHPPSEARSLHEKYSGPKDIHIIPHAGHTEWMCDDCDPFQNLVERIYQWVN